MSAYLYLCTQVILYLYGGLVGMETQMFCSREVCGVLPVMMALYHADLYDVSGNIVLQVHLETCVGRRGNIHWLPFLHRGPSLCALSRPEILLDLMSVTQHNHPHTCPSHALRAITCNLQKDDLCRERDHG